VLTRAKEDAVPLVVLSMVEERYDAVREVLDGATVKDTAVWIWSCSRVRALHRVASECHVAREAFLRFSPLIAIRLRRILSG
jgi:hypothetical protein